MFSVFTPAQGLMSVTVAKWCHLSPTMMRIHLPAGRNHHYVSQCARNLFVMSKQALTVEWIDASAAPGSLRLTANWPSAKGISVALVHGKWESRWPWPATKAVCACPCLRVCTVCVGVAHTHRSADFVSLHMTCRSIAQTPSPFIETNYCTCIRAVQEQNSFTAHAYVGLTSGCWPQWSVTALHGDRAGQHWPSSQFAATH